MTVVIASYNDTVREWNSRIASVPDNLAAGLTNAEKSDYMDIDPGASPARQVSF